MSMYDECDTSKDIDIVSGISIDTQYLVEKCCVKWRISNYSKIFNDIETTFFTTSKSTIWKLKFHYDVNDGCRIKLYKHFEMPDKIRVEYKAFTKTCHQLVQKEGIEQITKTCYPPVLLNIPLYERNPNNAVGYHKMKFENDILEFQCTMTIFGHTITKISHLPNMQSFTSKQINYDFENLLHSKEHSDVVISDGQNEIPAHKAILCARSPVFKVMFQQNMLENENNEVRIEDLDLDTLQDFLSFLYSGKISQMSCDSATKLYYAADKYEVTDLQDVCSEFLQFHLTIENSCSILQLADQHRDDKLKEQAVFFIQMHASSVKLTEGWKNLLRTHPKLIAEFFY